MDMVRTLATVTGIVALVSCAALGEAAGGAGYRGHDIVRDAKDIVHDRHDLYKDKADVTKDIKAGRYGEAAKDLKDVQRDQRDLRKDKADLKKDLGGH
jgi:hypothetical protein